MKEFNITLTGWKATALAVWVLYSTLYTIVDFSQRVVLGA